LLDDKELYRRAGERVEARRGFIVRLLT